MGCNCGFWLPHNANAIVGNLLPQPSAISSFSKLCQSVYRLNWCSLFLPLQSFQQKKLLLSIYQHRLQRNSSDQSPLFEVHKLTQLSGVVITPPIRVLENNPCKICQKIFFLKGIKVQQLILTCFIFLYFVFTLQLLIAIYFENYLNQRERSSSNLV